MFVPVSPRAIANRAERLRFFDTAREFPLAVEQQLSLSVHS